jgi:hypothetical protein
LVPHWLTKHSELKAACKSKGVNLC